MTGALGQAATGVGVHSDKRGRFVRANPKWIVICETAKEFLVPSKFLVGLAALCVCGAIAGHSHADFVPGNLVIYRVGDGSVALNDDSTAVFLDEYTPAGVFVSTIAMPIAAAGSNNALTAGGNVISEGLLTRSTDGTQLVLTGYAAAPGVDDVNSTATTGGSAVPRVVGLVSATGAIDTTTTTTRFSVETIRSAAYDPVAGAIWMTGTGGGVQGGVIATTLGGSGAGTQVSTTETNLRQVNIFDGQLYVSSNAGSTIRLGSVGTGEPTTAGEITTNLPNFPTTGGDRYAFFFADLSAGVTGVDTLYVASEDALALSKYSLVGGDWTFNNTVGTDGNNLRGLTGAVSGTTVTLYAIGSGNAMRSLVDTAGYNVNNNGILSGALVSAATNTAFRGIAFAPVAVPEPGAVLFGGLVCGVIGLAAAWRRIVGKPAPNSIG